MKIIFHSRIKTVLYLKYNHMNCFVGVLTEKWNSQHEHGQHMQLGYGSLSITTLVLRCGNEFNFCSVLHGQVSLAAVNQIYVVHEAMNHWKDLKIY